MAITIENKFIGAVQPTTPVTAQFGGTGLNAASASNGTTIIGNGSGFTLAALTGTTNRITISPGAGSITISAPQDLHSGATPTFGGLSLSSALTVANGGTGASSLSSNGILIGNGTGAVSASVLTNGQLLIGSTGVAPVAATLSGTTNQVSVGTGAGSITLSTPQDLHTGATLTFSALTLSSSLTVSAANIISDTTTGTKIGTATNQKFSFYNATPVIQQTQPSVLLTDNSGGSATNTIADSGAIYSQSNQNDFRASITAKVNQIINLLKAYGLSS